MMSARCATDSTSSQRTELRRATALEPDNARFVYAYAVALQSIGKVSEAIATLDRARASHPNDVDILSALARFTEDRGDLARARRYTEQLHALGRHDRN